MTTVYADGGWMWQFGEAAVSLGESALSLRHERGGAIPPMWPVSVHSPVVTFRRTVTNAAPAEIEVEADGDGTGGGSRARQDLWARAMHRRAPLRCRRLRRKRPPRSPRPRARSSTSDAKWRASSRWTVSRGKGASPAYLLGRYFLGVEPVKPGFAEYVVRPNPGGLRRMEGVVPTPIGDVSVKVDGEHLEVRGCNGVGKVFWRGRTCILPPDGLVEL